MIVEKEDVAFVYYEAREEMDHETAVRHTADVCGVSVRCAAEVLGEEATA